MLIAPIPAEPIGIQSSLFNEGLLRVAPTTGVIIGAAAATAEARGPAAGWEYLTSISVETVQSYQPYWALKAHLLQRLNRPAESEMAYERAIGRCEDRQCANSF